jgi:hypothetical protein
MYVCKPPITQYVFVICVYVLPEDDLFGPKNVVRNLPYIYNENSHF